ncbi:tyrosine-type recombinase/integrase [Peptoniphilus lacydonensis]|uniref:tyrosine-type recombinase/integrase n=1 Tax=Peptoniphilus lacydonensis TaxID=1673725 RepID=UPI0008DA29CA|nr:site-specific integrase [Peptoniphilus lacydonensis]
MKEKNSNGLGSLTYSMRNGKKYWTGRVTLGQDLEGNLVRKSFSSYKKYDVIEKMQKALAQTNIAGFTTSGDRRLDEFMSYWLYNIKTKEIKSTTVVRYESTIKWHIMPYPFSKIKVKDITILNLQNFINLLADGENTSINTVKNTLILIKNFLDYTIVLGIFPNNPADYVKVPKKEKVENTGKYRIFSADEQKLIINNLDLEDPVEQMLYIDFFTGLRRNEIRGLRWKNYSDGTLTIAQQLVRSYNFEKDGSRTINKNSTQDLKTESSFRTIVLPKMADNLLQKMKINSYEKHLRLGTPFTDDAFIFSDEYLKPIEEKRANRRIQAICRKIGIEPRPLHSIRHSYATRLFEADVDIKTVQKLMGHFDYRTTLNIYVHVMDEEKEKAAAVLDAMYN